MAMIIQIRCGQNNCAKFFPETADKYLDCCEPDPAFEVEEIAIMFCITIIIVIIIIIINIIIIIIVVIATIIMKLTQPSR